MFRGAGAAFVGNFEFWTIAFARDDVILNKRIHGYNILSLIIIYLEYFFNENSSKIKYSKIKVIKKLD